MSFTTDLLAGVAQLLEDEGVATWNPAGAYPADARRPIMMGVVPSGPDEVLTLTAYGITDDPSLSDSVHGMQVRGRAGRDPRTVDALLDDVFDVLHGLHGVDLPGGIRLELALRRSWTPLGADDNSRHERSDNYALTVHRPSPNRT